MRRSVLALLALPLVVFLVVGCGSGGALSLDPVASAATKTQQAGTFDFDYTASMQILGQQLSLSGSGQADAANGAMQMSLDFKGLPAALTQNGSTAQFLLVDKAMYLQMPFLAGKLPSGKQWLKVDLAAAMKSAGGSLGSFGQLDPQQWLQQLLASSNTQKLGTDTVQGEQMTHYRTTIDPSKIDSVPASLRAKVRKAMQQIGMTTIPVDVWVDGQGMLRREALSLTFGKALQGATMSMTFDMHDFGAPVNITAPPADQVLDAPSFATH
jgi:predicted small lipoprotein YifL